jgi:hypothetical protein
MSVIIRPISFKRKEKSLILEPYEILTERLAQNKIILGLTVRYAEVIPFFIMDCEH